MINKNNWYIKSQESSEIIHEAGILSNLQLSIVAVSLFFAGLSLKMISEKTGLSEIQIQQALNNKEIVETVKNKENPIKTIDQTVEKKDKQEVPKPSPNRFNWQKTEDLIRLNEISGSERYVTTLDKDTKKKKTYDITRPYPDPIHGWKVPTIGVGYNLNRPEAKEKMESLGLNYENMLSKKQNLTDEETLTIEQVNELYREDIAKAKSDAKRFLPSLEQQPTSVQTVLVDMSFNMGLTRLSKFKKLKKALEEKKYKEVIKEIKESRYYTQVGERPKRNIEILEKYLNYPR